jgi:hypothetical protein
MAQASRDSNNVPTLIAASSADGTTPIKVKANASNHGLEVDDDTTGTDHGVAAAVRDQNFVPVLLAVSSTTAVVGGISYIQNVTPVEVYADASGNLLVDSA